MSAFSDGRLREADRRIQHAIDTSRDSLSLNYLNLTEVPAAVAKLGKLRQLVLSNNCLALPPDVHAFRHLTKLDLSQNKLRRLPEEIGNLAELSSLDVSGNDLRDLPRSLAKLTNLKFLDVRGNPELGIPPEISNDSSTGGPAKPSDVLSFYFSLREESRSLNEAKILLVGQGSVGKTSLVRRLLHGTFDAEEKKTEGISIHRWEVSPRPLISVDDRPIRLNIWDFGGQEIMHATHQFFLTKRSVYLLVLDARKGENESNIHYWLKIIQSYGGDSPVLVVINKYDTHYLELNETRLKKDYYPNIVGFFKTSCLSALGINELRQALVQKIHELPHVYDLLPKSYFDVKNELEELAQKRDFIDIAEYEAICHKRRVLGSRETTRLLRFLHDLGSVLNFDDPDAPFELRDTNILNPEWVTGGVYKILNSNILMKAGGILNFAELAQILGEDPAYPRERHRFILEIMRKFELCFDFPDTKGQLLLIPELLSPNEPDIDWQYDECLNFEYHYRVLPPGLICRFIVRMHSNLTAKPTYWRSGVVLDVDGNRCLVRADADAAKIFISIKGPGESKRRALSVIRAVFKAIHATIPRIDPAEKVPLPDSQAVVVDYKHLIKLEEHGTTEFLPEGAERNYAVAALLDGIEVRVSSRKTPRKTFDEAKNVEQRVSRVVWLLLAFTLIIVTLMSGLAVISTWIGASNFVVITVAAILFLVLIFTMVGVVTKMLGPKSATRMIELVFKKLPALSATSADTEETATKQAVRKRRA